MSLIKIISALFALSQAIEKLAKALQKTVDEKKAVREAKIDEAFKQEKSSGRPDNSFWKDK